MWGELEGRLAEAPAVAGGSAPAVADAATAPELARSEALEWLDEWLPDRLDAAAAVAARRAVAQPLTPLNPRISTRTRSTSAGANDCRCGRRGAARCDAVARTLSAGSRGAPAAAARLLAFKKHAVPVRARSRSRRGGLYTCAA